MPTAASGRPLAPRPDLEGLEAAARERLPGPTYDYFAGGSGDESTLEAAAGAWARVRLRPRVLRDVTPLSTQTSVLGTPVASPILVAPVGYLRLAHPDGEAAIAAGAAAAGVLRVLSSRSNTPVAVVAEAAPGVPWWFQVYVMRDRELTAELVRRAAAAGATALVLTGDAPRLGRKRRGAIHLPPGHFMPDLTTAGGGDLRDDPRAVQDPATTFADVAWLREASGLPVVVKGVLRGDDARASLDAGAAAVIVSNHGGRQLDGALASADALAEVADAVAGEAEVYVDGGVRSGIDALRALGLGARAVFVGRPAVWALAVGGADGVRDLLLGLRAEFEEALALAGLTAPEQAGRDLIA